MMAPIRVTVKSKLPEFQGLNLNQAPIEPDITWAAFFQFHPQVDFNPNVHGISTTRNTAFAEDTIQQTSDLFQRSSILVNIVRVDRTNPPSPRIRRRRGDRSERRAGRNRNGIRLNRIPDVEIPIPMPSTSRGQRNDTGGIPVPRVSPTMNGHGRRPRNPLQIFPEDLMNGDDEDANGPGELDHLNYAESMASQDSQETEIIGNHNPSFSILKRRVLTEIGKVPNADFERMLREMRNLANGEQKYRWSRKAPMVGNMMFQAFHV